MDNMQDFNNFYSRVRNAGIAMVTLARQLEHDLPSNNPRVKSILGVLTNLLKQKDVLATIRKLARFDETHMANQFPEMSKLLSPD